MGLRWEVYVAGSEEMAVVLWMLLADTGDSGGEGGPDDESQEENQVWD